MTELSSFHPSQIENAHTTYLSPTTLPAYQTFFDVLLHFKRYVF
jgi:hypothetical protein